MYIKTIKYEDYYGNPVEEEFFFYMNKTEILRFLTNHGMVTDEKTLSKKLRGMKGRDIMEFFEDLIGSSYGEILEDSRRFHKSPELLQAFKETPAYDVLFMEVCTSTDSAIEFFKNIVPKEMAETLANRVLTGFGESSDGNSSIVPVQLLDHLKKQP